MDVVETLRAAGIIPVIVIDDQAKAVPLAKALVSGGLPVLEVTFRTAAAAGAIAKIRTEVPDAVVGAVQGPVTNMLPSSILQMHTDCWMFLDPASAAKLS